MIAKGIIFCQVKSVVKIFFLQFIPILMTQEWRGGNPNFKRRENIIKDEMIREGLKILVKGLILIAKMENKRIMEAVD